MSSLCLIGLVARCNSGAEIAADWCAQEAGGEEGQYIGLSKASPGQHQTCSTSSSRPFLSACEFTVTKFTCVVP